MTAAVDVRGLTYNYGDRVAVDDLSFAVPEGEVFGLLGPNGGGKTTLFRVLSTLVPVRGGEATVCGRDVRSEPDAVRGVLGVTFQSPSLDAKLTVRENLSYHAALYGLRGAAAKARVAAVAERLGVADRLGDLAGGLVGGPEAAGGDRQRSAARPPRAAAGRAERRPRPHRPRRPSGSCCGVCRPPTASPRSSPRT